jgi:hypothetical protein
MPACQRPLVGADIADQSDEFVAAASRRELEKTKW